MERHSEKGEFDAVYKYPISNPNVMEAHIFQLKDDVPASAGGGTMWLSMGSPRNAPYLPTMAIFSTPIRLTKN